LSEVPAHATDPLGQVKAITLNRMQYAPLLAGTHDTLDCEKPP
jgi:hypothetical protein